ncbi:hypothetical protein RND81_05G036700 [Saponaria officinalis]|uniref:Exostosin GT47 domain-containing protein n=1 Tax=Saponaria officinalis TaxID=3572 RepID=A0AAW1KSD0_SAPOF
MSCWLSLVKFIFIFMVPLILVSWLLISRNNPKFEQNSSDFSPKLVSTKELRSKIDGIIIGDIAEQATVTNNTAFHTPPLTIKAASSVQIHAANQSSSPKVIAPISDDKASGLLKETHVLSERKVKLEKIATKLGRLEVGLQKARLAIKDATYHKNQTRDSDFPAGPMYWNADAFHRSYLEMEKRLKVYVYEEGEPPLFHNGPCKSIYSTEGNFIHQMEIDLQFRTRNPEKAHVFFLPFSVAMMVQFVYVRDSRDFGTIRHTVRDYINIISSKYPYWNRSQAADHFMLSCHDWGPEASFSVPQLGKNAIRVLCNANTSEGFRPEKDVSFPEINLQTGSIHGFLGGPSPSRRSTLAFFAGGLHGPIRPILLEYWENKDDDLKIYEYLPKGISYYDMLRNSMFCICPSGYEVASPRVVEAIYTGCIPVLISDHYVPPFSDVLNWKSFSIHVSVNDIPNLKNILISISTRQYLKMYRRILKVRKHFEVNSPPKRYDFFHMILHSVWLRRLNVRVHDHQPL